jgi:hypothetical protein
LKKFAATVLLSAFVAAPALADNTGTYYVAADVGSATYSNVAPMPNPGVIRIAGGYHFSPVLAIELGYSMFADSNGFYAGNPTIISANSFQVAAVGTAPLTSQFDLIGKLGLTSNTENWTDLTGTSNYVRSDLSFGLGAQFHVNSQVAVRVLYDNYGKFDDYFYPLKATSLSLGMVYEFY